MENLGKYLFENVRIISKGEEYIAHVTDFSEAEENYDNEDSIVVDIKKGKRVQYGICFLASEIDSIEIIS